MHAPQPLSAAAPRQGVRHGLLLALTLAACAQDYKVVAGPVDVDPGEVTECGFTRVETTAFYRYDCNPVFTTTGEDWATSIGGSAFDVTDVMGHPFYQVWYVGVPDLEGYGDFGLGYAVSGDGTNWEPYEANPLLTEPDARAWDASMMDAMQVVWDPAIDSYVMLYQGYRIEERAEDQGWGLGAATSADGVSWKRVESNPVIDFMRPAEVNWCWPLALELGSVAGYTGYIAGSPMDAPNLDAQTCDVYQINGSSESAWTPDTDEIVFRAGPRGEWDDQGIGSMAIAELDGTRYLFYVGYGGGEEHSTYISAVNSYFGWAEWDGTAWVRNGMIPLHNTEDGQVRAVGARTVGTRVHLWISDDYDGAGAIGYFLFDPEAAAAEDAG
jgi:hypothetical protein